MDFIDTHQHLIWSDRFGYGWTDDIPELADRSFTPDDYREAREGRNVVGSIFMEAGADDPDYKEEARYVAGLIGSHGILAQIASCRPEEDGFDEWIEECLDLNVVGFRRLLHVVPDGLSRSDLFRANLRKLGLINRVFDLCLFARQLPIAIELAQTCPDLVFVLDHCGNPDIENGEFDAWAEDVKSLSALPNMNIKLSGVTSRCPEGLDRKATLQRHVDLMLETFGPTRIVWGSDWPVVNLGKGLADWLDMSAALLAELSTDEQLQVAQKNAKDIYGVRLP